MYCMEQCLQYTINNKLIIVTIIRLELQRTQYNIEIGIHGDLSYIALSLMHNRSCYNFQILSKIGMLQLDVNISHVGFDVT